MTFARTVRRARRLLAAGRVRAAGAAAAGVAAVVVGPAAAALAEPGALPVANPSSASGGSAAAAGAGPSGMSGSAASGLGGFQITATGSGISAYYEQPNFPVPATPTGELDLGYSTASFDSGPTGQATSSTVYPGQVVASSGSQLGALVPGVPLPPAPDWPVQSAAKYPQGPDSVSNDQVPGVAMDADTNSGASASSASIGSTGGQSGPNGAPASPFAVPTGFLTAQWIASASQSTVDESGAAVSRATAAVHGVTILGGVVVIGDVVSTATASSDGTTAKVTGTTDVADVEVGGQAVTVDGSGIHPSGNGAGSGGPSPTMPDLSSAFGSAGQLLSKLGITMKVTAPTDTVDGAQGERRLDGLALTVDLKTFDSAARQLAAFLPAQLVANLPLPVPDRQTVTLDLGWVDVRTGASTPFDASAYAALGSGGGGSGYDTGTGGSSFDASGGVAGTASAPSAVASALPSGTAGRRGATGILTAVAGSPVFRGVGAGLIVGGIALALAMARALMALDSSAARSMGECDGGAGAEPEAT